MPHVPPYVDVRCMNATHGGGKVRVNYLKIPSTGCCGMVEGGKVLPRYGPLPSGPPGPGGRPYLRRSPFYRLY